MSVVRHSVLPLFQSVGQHLLLIRLQIHLVERACCQHIEHFLAVIIVDHLSELILSDRK